jgi:hypothetical protein
VSISGPLLPSKAVIRAACRVVAFESGAAIAAIRRTDVTEYWPGLPRQSALMLAATITLPHLLVSSEMSLPKSADDPESAVRLRPFLRHCHEASSSSKALAFFRSSVSKPSVNQL